MSHSDTPGVIAPPPLIFFGTEAVFLLLNWAVPLRFLPDPLTWVAGIILIVIGLLLGFTALAAMRRAHTSVDPFEPSTAVVSDGPYRMTRNPIYLGFVFAYLGFACLFNTVWPLLALPFVLVVVDRLVIAREERYLASKFGGAYTSYKAKVRRWI